MIYESVESEKPKPDMIDVALRIGVDDQLTANPTREDGIKSDGRKFIKFDFPGVAFLTDQQKTQLDKIRDRLLA